jgi:hypothetical protein
MHHKLFGVPDLESCVTFPLSPVTFFSASARDLLVATPKPDAVAATAANSLEHKAKRHHQIAPGFG